MKTSLLKLFIFIFCFFLFSFGAQNVSLEFKGDENFYFESAKGMLETGDVVTPRYMGEERFQKPILFYWLILASFRIFDINWFSARLPSILFGVFLTLLVFAISNLFFEDLKLSLFSSLFLATTPLYYRYARLAVPDMTLVFFMSLALYYFLRYYKDRTDSKNSNLFFLALALAFLVKGPVGLIIPLLIVSSFCLIKKVNPFDWRNILTGIAIFAVIASPWFYLTYKIHRETYISLVWSREILQRLGYGHALPFLKRYSSSLFFYTSALITKFLPYSLFIPIAFTDSLKVSSNSYEEAKKSAHLFLVIWIAAIFLFFTFVAEKRVHYLLALSPAVSILVGVVFKKAILDKFIFSRASFKVPYTATLIAIIFFIVLFIFSDYISGVNKIPVWKFTLIIVPVILAIGFRYRNSSFMPLSFVLSISALYIAMAISQPFGLFTNRMERAAKIIRSELKEGDRIGIGSHGIIPEELQVFFDVPVENVKVMYKHDNTPDLESASRLIQFLNSDEQIFCVIKRLDYETFIPKEIEKNLYILDRYYVWKRRIKFDKTLKLIDKIESYSLRDIFQNEIYVITNREP